MLFLAINHRSVLKSALKLVLDSIFRINQLTLASHLVFVPLTFVFTFFFKSQYSISMSFILRPLSLIHVPIHVMHDSVSMSEPLVPLPVIDTAILVLHNPKAIGQVVSPLSFEQISVGINYSSRPTKPIVLPLTLKSLACSVGEFSFKWLVISPITNESVAILISTDSLSISFSINKVSLIGSSIFVILENSFALNFVFVEFAFILDLVDNVD